MSRLADLIANFHPGGVPALPVSEAASVVSAPVKIKRERFADGSAYPIVDQGQSYIAGHTDDMSALLPTAEYVVFGDHTRTVKWVPFAFAQGADGLKILRAAEGVVPRYLFYALEALRVPSRGYNRHWPIVQHLEIPVPDAAVQFAVVETLDRFIELGHALTDELAARRRQLAHYRERLFEFPAEVPHESLGSHGGFLRGRRFTKDDIVSEGVPSVHYGEIYTRYGTTAERAFSYVRPELADKLRYAEPRNLIIAAVGETVEEVAKAVAWLGSEPVAVHDDCFAYQHSLDPRYVAHFFQTAAFHRQKARHVSRAKNNRISDVGLAKIAIPVPEPAQQQRVANTLDRFEALLHHPEAGLSAELHARRAQYVHYRDRLLKDHLAPETPNR